ncbi:MAG: ribonuclease III [Fimbriimonadaceae bacterium]|nr:ribonuclease III [Fimbriimonadaceae bacterium]
MSRAKRPAQRPRRALQERRAAFLDRLGLHFNDPTLLHQALRHPSYTREQELAPQCSNERLEYLGDAVLQLVVSEHLFAALPQAAEGELTTARAGWVRGSSLAAWAAQIELAEVLEIGSNLDLSQARSRRSVLACAAEALLGAVYLDQGYAAARDLVLATLPAVAGRVAARNAKGELQEWTQPRCGEAPTYHLRQASGPAHQRWFEVEVRVGSRVVGLGGGPSRKDAEQAAAHAALQELGAATLGES